MDKLAFRILSAQESSIFYLGQAGFVFKSKKGTVLGVDMYLTHCVERVEGHIGYKRLLPIVLGPSDIQFDYIIATHPHFDHFDMDAIPTLMANHHTKLFASVNCEAEVKRLMMTNENVTYVKPEDVVKVDDITIEFVHCDHGINTPDAVGLIIEMDSKRIYIAGDTCLHTEWAKDIKDIDILIAPINGAYGNLNEKECVILSKEIAPKITIPCHYGMFASHGGNPGLFKEYMEQEKLPFMLMTVGEQYKMEELK